MADLAFAQVPANSITIVISPDESAALAALSAHEGAANAHPQYLLRKDVAKDAGPLMGLMHAVGSAANSLLLSLDAPESVLPALAKFQRFQFTALFTNGAGGVTANVEGLGAIAVKRGGDTGLVDLDPGDIKAGSLYDLNFDGTYFQLGGGVGGGKAFERFSFVAGVGQNEFTFPHVPGSVIALRNGREIYDFTSAVDGSKATLAIPCNIDDRIEFLAFKSFKVADAYTKAEIDALLLTAGAMPVGSMLPMPTAIVPPGYLEIDGSVKSIAVYPDLAAYLGTAFNKGDEGAGNFRLPESRAEFLRGWDHGRGVDAGRAIGSWQKGSLQSFDPSTAQAAVTGLWHNAADVNVDALHGLDKLVVADYPVSQAVGVASGTTNAAGVGLGVTRPRNLAVMWCIKAWNAPINQGNIDIAALAADAEASKALGVAGTHKKLRASATGTSAIVTVTADQLIVGNAFDRKSLSGVNLSISTAVVGVNGLDVGPVVGATWYAIWVVWDGVTITGRLSLSATGPSVPADYLTARVGWIRTDNTANKYPLSFGQVGRTILYDLSANLLGNPVIATGVAGNIAGSPAGWVEASLVAVVPPTAIKLSCYLGNSIGSGTGIVAPTNKWGGVGSSVSTPFIVSAGSAAPQSITADFALMDRKMYYASNVASMTLNCLGWEDDI
ncbi:tail fiber protein [Pseudomonas sp. SWRI74]|uniref:Tail fiber protein n=2 Tax=Pseudomonas azerbaijanoccidentalis TaxID=2842347 RepID=A0ABS6QZQ2_9PSED|nr:tail fiber protein [Pseudomonas azerbaijanoccidentalis]